MAKVSVSACVCLPNSDRVVGDKPYLAHQDKVVALRLWLDGVSESSPGLGSSTLMNLRNMVDTSEDLKASFHEAAICTAWRMNQWAINKAWELDPCQIKNCEGVFHPNLTVYPSRRYDDWHQPRLQDGQSAGLVGGCLNHHKASFIRKVGFEGMHTRQIAGSATPVKGKQQIGNHSTIKNVQSCILEWGM